VFVLERAPATNALAQLGPVEVRETEDMSERALGAALTDALRSCAETTEPARLWVVTDLNGEATRALEWGHALVRLNKHNLEVDPQWTPAVGLGDTGAAAGGVALCAVIRAFARGYAPAPLAIITLTDERACAGLTVTQP
jgi:3-oxoacyl-[acyl-carrier-protein] synthase-1